jgi:chemotaxis protein MotB
MAMIIEKMPNNLNIEVRGHTGSSEPIGSGYKDNWELSSARAISVVKELIKQGVNKAKLHASGYSDTKPIALNKTKKGKEKNNRVDIYFFTDKDYKRGSQADRYKTSILDKKVKVNNGNSILDN